ADAADLKSAGRKAVGVQVPLRAPIKSITYGDYPGNLHPGIQRWCHFWCHFVLTLLGSHIGGRSYAEEGGSQRTRSLRKGARLRHLVDTFQRRRCRAPGKGGAP